MRATLCLLLAALALAAAGCGGGGGGEAAGDTTETTAVETTETTATTDDSDDGSSADEGAPEAPNTKICQEVANTSSQLNIAASNGDFATVVIRWKMLLPEFPANVQPQLETLIEGYEKIVADPNNFGVLDTSPYREALEAVNAYTAKTCGN